LNPSKNGGAVFFQCGVSPDENGDFISGTKQTPNRSKFREKVGEVRRSTEINPWEKKTASVGPLRFFRPGGGSSARRQSPGWGFYDPARWSSGKLLSRVWAREKRNLLKKGPPTVDGAYSLVLISGWAPRNGTGGSARKFRGKKHPRPTNGFRSLLHRKREPKASKGGEFPSHFSRASKLLAFDGGS